MIHHLLPIQLIASSNNPGMSCSHLSQITAPNPSYKPVIYKDECTICYKNDIIDNQQPDQPLSGINVCMICYNGSCIDHTMRHYNTTKHSIVLNMKRYVIDDNQSQSQTQPIINSINDMLQTDKGIEYHTEHQLYCLQCNSTLQLDVTNQQSNKIQSYIDIVLNSDSATKSDILSFDDTPKHCMHTNNLQQHIITPVSSKQQSQCSECELNSNLWLCMTCGNLACGRKQQGSDVLGNGHALSHYNATEHCVALKLGTITSNDTDEVTADLFCYQCDNTVLDKHLNTHLQKLGIIVSEQSVTEKTTTELSLQQNLSHNWNLVCDSDGNTSNLLYGPLHTGLQNLGNTCYLASTVQALFSIPQFQQQYYVLGQQHINTCTQIQPAKCYMCQMSKLAIGMSSHTILLLYAFIKFF